MLDAALVAGAIDEDQAHRLGRRREEVVAALPSPPPAAPDQSQICLVDQGRGLEGLPGLLLREPLCGQLAQLVVDQRQEFLNRLGVAVLDVREDAGDVVHRRGSPEDDGPATTACPELRRSDRIAARPGIVSSPQD